MRRALPVAVSLLVAALVVVAFALLAPQPAAPPDSPNVVLIIGCTVRKDQVTPYGGPDTVTPYLARVAATGTLFADGIVAAPWTRPGTISVITGQHAASIGMVEPSARGNSRRLSSRVTTLAELFRAAGYTTHGATANPNANALFGFDQGFDDYHEASSLWRDAGVVKVQGDALADVVVASVRDRHAPGPFYLQILMVDAHEPYDTPVGEAYALVADGAPVRVGRYRGALRRFDRSVEHLVSGLAALGHTERDTIFAVVSDHGEGLRYPKHHGRAHGVYTFSSTVEMPWIVWGSGIARGHVVGGVASQVDVTPTLLGLARVGGYEGPGMDWAAQARGELERTTRERAFVDTWFASASRAAVYTDRFACHEAFEMGTAPPVPRTLAHTGCFDRVQDREATRALNPAPEGLVEALREWRSVQWDAYQAWPDTSDADVDDALSRQLEALGYVQGDD